MTLLEDFEIAEEVVTDIVEIGQGQPTTVTKQVGSGTLTAEIVKLPNGPQAPYVVFEGSFLSMFVLGLENAAGLVAGAPVAIAEKVADTWYGETIQYTAGTPAPAEAPASAPESTDGGSATTHVNS